MGQLLNQHSYLVIAAVVALALGLAVIRTHSPVMRVAAVAGVLAALIAVPLVFRSGPGSVASQESFARDIRSGNPTLVEFYSDY